MTAGNGDYYKSFVRVMCRYYGSNSGKELSPTGVRDSIPEKPLEVMTPGCGWVVFCQVTCKGKAVPSRESNINTNS